jgi:hypothetical protein
MAAEFARISTSVNEPAANLAEAPKSGGPLHRAGKLLLT